MMNRNWQVNDFVCISDRAYTHQQILMMEKAILGKLEWTLTVPTPYVFLVRFVKASIPDTQVRHLVIIRMQSLSRFMNFPINFIYFVCLSSSSHIDGTHGLFLC